MVTRALIVVALVSAAGIVSRGAGRHEAAVSRVPLASLSETVDGWTAHPAPTFSEDIVAQLGVDEYIHRQYARASQPVINVYVGYYGSQRQGDTIHSPQNCLPGAGWRPISSDRATIDAGGVKLPVNRYLIERGLDRQAVIYWYQGRGRVVANEYVNKAWLMVDAARLGRTDGALVRLITPVADTPSAAFEELTVFAAAFYPHLRAHIP
jgi:EpsI family protein